MNYINIIKKWAYKKLDLIPFNLGVKYKFHRIHGYPINEKSFSSKIQRRKFKGKNSLFSLCSCKFSVREYVRLKVGDDVLIPLLFVSDRINVKDVNQFDKDVVLKASHNSGPVYIIDKNSSVNIEHVVHDLNKQLTIDYGIKSREKWYSAITPLIIAEEKLTTQDGEIPEDYKFHVFNQGNGEFEIFIQIDFSRHDNHSRTIYDKNLNIIDTSICYPNYNIEHSKPKNFDYMIEVAKKLASDFSYVRVDLYNVNGKVYFGELTFAHGGGFEKFSNYEYDLLFGNLWLLND